MELSIYSVWFSHYTKMKCCDDDEWTSAKSSNHISIVRLPSCVSGQHESNSATLLYMYTIRGIDLLSLVSSASYSHYTYRQQRSSLSLSLLYCTYTVVFIVLLCESVPRRGSFVVASKRIIKPLPPPLYAVIVRQNTAETAGHFIDGLLLLMCVWQRQLNWFVSNQWCTSSFVIRLRLLFSQSASLFSWSLFSIFHQRLAFLISSKIKY